MNSPSLFTCERCGGGLAPDDAIAIIEGLCAQCRFASADVDPVPPESMPRPMADADDVQPSALDELVRVDDYATPREPRRSGEVEARAGLHPAVIVPPPFAPARSVPPRVRGRARDLVIGGASGLALTLAVTAYILFSQAGSAPEIVGVPQPTEQALTVRVDPSWATVRLGDRSLEPPDETGRLTLSVAPGEECAQWLEVSAEGYHSDRRPVATVFGAGEVLIELVRKPYEVVIRTEPSEAEVWVNDRLKGYTPLTLSVLPHEEAVLSVKRRGYETVTERLKPPARSGRLDLDLTLPPSGPVVRVETDPPGAVVSADGAPQGASPVTIRLDASYLGKEVAISASVPGYDQGVSRLKLPEAATEEIDPVRLTLQRTRIEVNIDTEPAGGTVVLDGKILGVAPVTASFDPDQTGRPVVVQVSLAGSHHGRQEFTVPPPGDPTRLTIPMQFAAQRVLFVLLPARDAPEANVAVAERAVELIHALTPQQRFALLGGTESGLESWPGGLGTEAATSEQKVRAYDVARSLRPAGAGGIGEVLSAAPQFEPTTIWLLTAGPLERRELEQLGDALGGQEVAVHLVFPNAGLVDDWLVRWAGRLDGTVTLTGRADAPVAVGDSENAD